MLLQQKMVASCAMFTARDKVRVKHGCYVPEVKLGVILQF